LWVDVDGFAGLHEATNHLIGRGLRRIGYLGWPAGSGTGDERRRGWAAAMAEHFGHSPSELDALTITTEEGVPDARRAIEQLFSTDHGLDGLVCVSDSLALGAMMAVNEAGQRSFPIIGFDNTPVAQAVGLSSVEQQLDQVAAATLELLMGATGRRIMPHGSAADDPRHRLVTPKLVVRRSSHLAPVEEAGTNTPGDHNRKEEQ
jgi:DNA-binding LacI/PurR family transcriptional regulator